MEAVVLFWIGVVAGVIAATIILQLDRRKKPRCGKVNCKRRTD